ncbi:long-chain fatty acid--CoA ligase [Burkholderia aenigmatica]|uniref:Long-chain-fatty-acid--CoA ligase n=1 Tax=Burkholderia aenigmatica TaxID=2015348 RepID=A0ABY6XTY4_9BURK|nr:AMP-binding protein [Burkholderia aenigmatica]VWC73838.1 long-chain fatty acid--CoA ligase [Burkholderia aenigmatica]
MGDQNTTLSPRDRESHPRSSWVDSYPPHVPSAIELKDHSSICGYFEHAVKKYADRPAITCLGQSFTYAALNQQTRSFAAWLQSLGLPTGARVALMLPSGIQYVVAMFGVLRAGYVVVNVNPMYTARELTHQLNDSGAESIIVLEQFASTFQQVRAGVRIKHVIVVTMGDLFGWLKGHAINFAIRRLRKDVPAWSLPGHHSFSKAIANGKSMALHEVTLQQTDLAMLQYTGGTTGVAKGAMLLHRNLLAASTIAGTWLNVALQTEPAISRPVMVLPLPLYHIFTIYTLMVGFGAGACSVLIPNPRDVDSLVKTMRAQRFHLMFGLNTLYNALLNHPEGKQVDYSTCRAFVAGGTATQQPVAEAWHRLTGRWIVEGWGMTETTGAGTCNPPHRDEFNGSIGLPLPSVTISIRDDDGRELPAGSVGEICISGPQVMAGYWQRPDETQQVLGSDGFLKTGDVGVMDAQGYVRVVDRKKDMILVSGFNMYPAEIEEVAMSLAGVLEAAAVGVPSESTGESVKLFVVRKDARLTVEQVRSHCAMNLTNYKRPQRIVFVDSLPKSPVGKVLRRELRDYQH